MSDRPTNDAARTNAQTNGQPPDDLMPKLVGLLTVLRRRQRGINAMQYATLGLFIGLLAAVAMVLTAWAVQSSAMQRPTVLIAQCGVLVAVACALGALVGALLPIEDLRLARAIDRAAGSEDRFASALQLAHHRRQDRAQLIAVDALARVRDTPAAAALPLRIPRLARWSVMPLCALCALLALLPAQAPAIAAAPAPEISSDEWERLHEEFAREIRQLPKAESPEEQEMRALLEDLAKLLEQNPEKRDVLTEIAKISEKVEKQRQALSTRDLNMKSAAKAIARSEALKQFASTLKQGEYEKAANELQQLAEQMEAGEVALDANEFESVAEDMEKLAQELSSQAEMEKSAQECSKSASSMNKKELAEAMKRLAQQMKSNSSSMCKSDACRRSSSLLDMLRRGMSQCKGGNCQGNGLMPGMGAGAKKGGLKAGWGSAEQWDGGELAKDEAGHVPDLANDMERAGENSSFKIVSPDERARSGKTYEELYAEFVQKTEADLDLDNVPVAYREYLRKYFNAIRPQETPKQKDEGGAAGAASSAPASQH